MKIYVVTKGVYSDYHVITATTDKKLAYQIKEKFDSSYGGTNVEVFEDAEIFVKPCFFFRFDKDGKIIETESRNNSEDSYDCSSGYDVKGNFYTNVVADDLESAIKIGAEKRAMCLAKKHGIC